VIFILLAAECLHLLELIHIRITPRQRIVLYREMKALERAPKTAENLANLEQLRAVFAYVR